MNWTLGRSVFTRSPASRARLLFRVEEETYDFVFCGTQQMNFSVVCPVFLIWCFS